MRLIKVGCGGYKRFRDRAEMDVDSKLIAIVGPNEAGKTSFLDALAYIDSDRSLEPREQTRGPGPPQTTVWARYALEDSDKDALAAIPEAREVRQLVVSKSDGGLEFELEPDVNRDLRPRRACRDLMDKALAHRLLRDRPDDDELRRLASVVQAALGSDEDLSDEELEQIVALASALTDASALKQFQTLARRLTELRDHEGRTHPWSEAVEILGARRPRFLPFEADARDLRSAYSFDETPNAALHNLLALAETSWTALYEASRDPGRIEGALQLANEKLREAFRAWQQSDMTVRLRVADNVVHVLVNMVEPGDYIGIGERSAGLRHFVALRAHIASTDAGPEPVLLVDEADIHLHYDAQADLIQVLDVQEDAAKVIYTTHSAGCLPPDLGTGIRIIVPTKQNDADGVLRETDHSKIINWFWTEEIEGTGFSPILIGMGASALAFAATRRAVIAEGPSDAILLPTLFREVMGVDRLDFQVAPGLSNVSEEAAQELDLVAARVVHLLDGDKGGKEIESLLLRAGVPRERILRLSSRKTEPLVLEDLLDADVYLQAVNAEIARWHDDPPAMPKTKLSKTLRPQSVKRWCESLNPAIEPPGRRAVAHSVLEQRSSRPLVAGNRRARLKKLYGLIDALLSRPSHAG